MGSTSAKRDRAGVEAIYDELVAQILDGTIYAPVEAVYPIEKIQEALAHSQRPAHGGKILVAPNGMI
jgi:NADPH:quinone reductase-like Zn-dependent oxidoreductase